MVQSITRRITASEYLQMPESNQRTELLDGQLIIYGEDVVGPAPVNDHQRLVRRGSRVLENLITNGEVFTAPTDVHFDELNVTQPDIFGVAENSRCVEVFNWVDDVFIQQGVYGPDDSFVSAVLDGKTVDIRQIFPQAN